MYNFSDLIASIVTKSELEDFCLEIDRFIDSLYVSKETMDEKLKKHIAFDRREELIKLFSQHNINETNLLTIKDLMLNLREDLKTTPTIEFTLAFDPNRQFLEKISVWLQHSLGTKVILSLILNPKIIGGVIISFKGQYRDFSIKKMLDEKLKNGTVLILS